MSRTGQLGLVPHAANLAQHMIEWVTRAPVHHVIVAIDETTCVSPEMPKVRTRPVSHFPDAVWSEFDLTVAQRRKITGFVTAQVGKPYSLLDDLLIGIALITREQTPTWIESRLNDDDQWQCAELADAAYQHAGIHLFTDGRPPAAVYPGSFLPIFEAAGWWPRRLSRMRSADPIR